MYLPILPASIPARSVTQYIPAYTSADYLREGDSNGEPEGPRKGLEEWSSLIGIVTAIVGNILIALALNVQRYAHIQLHRERVRERERAKQALKNAKNGGPRTGYGSVDEPQDGANTPNGDDEAQGAQESDPLTQSFQSGDSRWSENSDDDITKHPKNYLQSPSWWLGQILITVGEMGNFLAYGFAPASIVSPLGVVALVSNCIIAPIVFKEKFRKRDFWGVVIAVFGAVTVVLSANTQETKLDPHAVWDAITTTAFEVYMGVTCGLIVLLMWLSPKYGNRTILIDLGLVGLFGGYTALSTKGVSSMLSSTLLRAFTTPVTYVLLLILLGTAVMQVRYVNKALQRFDSTQVIPIQFVSFTLCVIIGSAVLYRDFERTTAEQAIKFVGGCFLTFFGVFLITSGRDAVDEDEDMLSDDEDVEETIGLAEQDPDEAQSPTQQRRRGSDPKRSRRSSRVSFIDAINKPLTVLQESGVPTSRTPTTTSKTSLLPPGDAGESAPLLRSRSQEPHSTPPVHPGISHAMSSESAISVSSATPVNSEPPTHPSTPLAQNSALPAINIPHDASPVTPRPQSASRAHTHHFTGPLFSPSPFHSTVSGLVPSNLLKDAHAARRPPSRRRPSLRSSLYVSQDELAVEPIGEEEERVIMSAIERSRTADESQIPGQPGKKGVRARAKSLTNSVGDLFGVRRKRDNGSVREGEESGQSSQRVGDASTETL
ncbi:hypothetical protein J7T55_007490 [Diaporthe amygdali]|uniref:uncharacterized protein n=1 Tax=Phomopsis amygdali TaxID=1214568 RepID=UPI0022FEF5B4|nr:uncharacterized protein J7T55_007490 [Diaporthe amygdali]KAJ0116510.1 hypothetical protein J7T55_007490 [Diaporthe amygdali]